MMHLEVDPRWSWQAPKVTLESATEEQGKQFEVRKLPVLIGRDRFAEVRIDDPDVAPYQCMLDRLGQDLVVWDLGTVSGTSLNGARVSKAVVRPSDRLRLGNTEWIVRF